MQRIVQSGQLTRITSRASQRGARGRRVYLVVGRYDPVAALAIVPIVIKEGLEAFEVDLPE